MPDDRGTIRQVAWTELFPWLELVRTFRLAIQARFLLLAAVGLLLTFAGWWFAATLFSGSEEPELQNWLTHYGRGPWINAPYEPSVNELRDTAPEIPGPEQLVRGPARLGDVTDNPLVAAWYNLSAPFRQLFDPQLSIVGLAFLIVAGLWAAVVWGFIGGVITRLAALQLARSERGSLRGAIRYVLARYAGYVTAPLFPLLGVLLFVLPLAIVGLVGHAGSAGMTVLAFLWPVFLIAGLVMTIFLTGLLFGWPLMWPTISVEGTDSFDALSRSYSYVYQRPLHYLGFAVLAALLGVLGGIVVHYFAAAVWYLTGWAVSWGAGPILLGDSSAGAPLAARLLAFWEGLVQLLTVSFVYSFFLCASTIIYFLLRQEVDGTETDEIFVDDQTGKFGLPPVTTDAAGVASIAGEEAEDELATNGAGDATS